MLTKRIARLVLLGALALSLAACNLPGLGTPTPIVIPIGPPETAPPASVPTPTQPPAAAVSPTVEIEAPVATPPILAPVTAPSLVNVEMLDASVGWGWTDQAVVRTHDGGVTWENVTPGGGIPKSVSLSGAFLDRDHAWILIPAEDYSSGELYRTADGGLNWQASTIPFGGAGLHFLDPLIGWALVGTGAAAGSHAVDIYQTTDGGANWTRIYSLDPTQGEASGGLPFSGSKNGLAFCDPAHGWLAGSVPIDGYVYLYATDNGGLSWKKQEPALPAGFEQAMTVAEPPRFFSPQVGVLPLKLFQGDAEATVFYHTNDCGATWSPSTPVELIGVYTIAAPELLWVSDGAVYAASYNGGQSWMTIQPNLNLEERLIRLDFVDPAQGWALASEESGLNQLYRTQDGGYTWTPAFIISPSPTAEISPSATTASASPTPQPSATSTPKPPSYAGPAARKGPTILAGYVSKAPTLDGSFDEWKQTRYDVTAIVFGKTNWQGADDLRGKLMLAWDEKHLYLAARVWDDVYAQNAYGEDLFKGDSVEFLLDADVPGDYYLDGLSPDDFQVGISPGSVYPDEDQPRPEAYLWYPKAEAGVLDQVKIGVSFVDDGYKLEAAIPWSIFGVNPKAGRHYGFVFSISDNDNPAKNVQQSMASTTAGRRLTNPLTWGDLQLVGP